MRITPLLIFAAFIVSCSSKSELLPASKIDELKANFTARIREIDTANRLDSFRLIRIDTLTQKDRIWLITVNLTSDIESLKDEANKLLEDYKDRLNQMNLSNGISSVLYSNYKSEAESYQRQGLEKIERAKELIDKKDSYISQEKTADSISPVAFTAVCLYQLRRPDQSVQKDTTQIILNTDKNIITVADYLGKY